MKLTGQMLYWDNGREIRKTVTEAMITADRIAIDWDEGEHLGHLDGVSTDGIHFQGHYGYPVSNDGFRCEFTLYTAKDDALLFGSWYETGAGWEGVWIFKLSPSVPVGPK
jgi:hypothetical protein